MTVHYPDPFGPPWRLNWLRLLLQWKGGIFQNFMFEWLTMVLFNSIAVLIVYEVTKDRNQPLSESKDTLAEICGFIGRRFQAAIGMMLGFYNGTMYSRWTTTRDKECATLRNINDVATQIAWRIQNDKVSVQEPENGDKDVKLDPKNIKIKLVRWINLSHAIVVGRLYEDPQNDFSSLEKLLACGLASDQEYLYLKEQNSRFDYVEPLMWFQNIIRDLGNKELLGLDDGSINVFAGPLLNLRGSLADLYMISNEPVPLIYRQLVNFSVRSYMVFLMLDAIMLEFRKPNNEGGLTKGSFWVIMMFAFEYFLFVGWLTASDAIGNPFRCWSDALEWENYVKKISQSSVQIALGTGNSSMPDTLESAEQVETWTGQFENLETASSCSTDRNEIRKQLTGFYI